MGYAEDENRYWREDCVQRGVFPDGMRLYCALTAEEARFVQDAAFRVLPWSTRATLAFHSCAPTSGSFSSIVDGCRDGAVVVRIIVPLLSLRAISSEVDPAIFRVAQADIPALNQMLRDKLSFVFWWGRTD
jgi:hypothetical protein